MIDAARLLKDLQGELGRLTADLLTHVQEDPDVRARLEGEWRKAFDAQRTGRTFEDWLDDRLTQVAVAWLLAFVFVRFCEDNGLIDEARIAGVGVRGGEARDAQQRFFSQHPHMSDRDYLHEVFRSAATLRGLDGVVGEGESPLWLVDPPADAITRVLALFRATDEAGDLVHDFTDPELSTRFLGDLYQDLSEHAKSNYALLQTPEFVEEFILDRTLDPAIDTFGLASTTMIDPTCGSGHFLLGGFRRIFKAWRAAEPGVSAREHAERALKAVTGVDLNPFAAGIARFRLLVAALVASGELRLADAPMLEPDVAVGDSLLWGARSGQLAGMEIASTSSDRQFLYATEHADQLRRIFDRQYAAVVGNPPYIIVKDSALNEQYRARYRSCHRQYSLGVPFTERFFELAQQHDGLGRQAGYVGMITANTFMKREFGTKIIEEVIPSLDLTHVIDTSLPEIPGHNQTVILFGRNRRPLLDSVRAVMGIKGESKTPADPSQGEVWRAILNQVDDPGSESEYVTVGDLPRSRFSRHPWNLGGGGAAELKQAIDSVAVRSLSDVVEAISALVITREDDAFMAPARSWLRHGVPQDFVIRVCRGEDVRDWAIGGELSSLFPYDGHLRPTTGSSGELGRLLWTSKQYLLRRKELGGYQTEIGKTWYEWNRFLTHRFVPPRFIAYAEVATHNHFSYHEGPVAFVQTAPVIKLRADASTDDYLRLLPILGCSVACFWMKQVCYKKSSAHGGGSTDQPFTHMYGFNGTQLLRLPLPSGYELIDIGRTLTDLVDSAQSASPRQAVVADRPTEELLRSARTRAESSWSSLTSLQEELDWLALHLYGVTDSTVVAPKGLEPPPLELGERAFEIVMARRMVAGELETAWFDRHGSTPITELPEHWPDWYQDLVNERIRLIETDRDVGLIERPEHKRRWAREPWEKQQERALREWLQDRLEARELWFEGSGDQERAVCRSVAQLTDRVLATDPEFLDVARLWKGGVEIDPVQVVAELVAEEHVPAQSGARYKGKGFDKRRQWERTWELQKMEDDGLPLPDGLDRIPVPPKYTSGEFAKPSYWRHRGKLDVPKERFTSIWGAESAADGTMVLAWAGFDHVQLTQAIGALLVDRQATDGWDAERSWPLVVAMAEQLFWLDLWHHEHDPRWGDSPANLFRSMVTEQAHRGGRNLADVADWRAPAPTRGRKKKDGA